MISFSQQILLLYIFIYLIVRYFFKLPKAAKLKKLNKQSSISLKLLNYLKDQVFLIVGIITVVIASRFDIPPRNSNELSFVGKFPRKVDGLVDAAGAFSVEEKKDINAAIQSGKKYFNGQLVVATIPSLEGVTIEEYGYQLGRYWKLGSKGKNNGVCFLWAPNARKVRIEVGYDLENILTDSVTSLIIQKNILPYFKKKQYVDGIKEGINAIHSSFISGNEIRESSDPSSTLNGELGILFCLALWGIRLFWGRRGGGGFGGGGRGGGGFGGGGSSSGY